MDQEILFEQFNELRQDYEQNGKGRTVEDWLKDAVMRHFKKSEQEAATISNDLIKGINSYREQREKVKDISVENAFAIDSLSVQERKLLTETTESISENILNDEDFDEIRKLLKGEEKQ